MNKICYGCGVKLQMEDSSKAGYTPKEGSVYCQNCFRQMHYGVHKDDNLPKDENIIINAINKEATHTLFLTDFYNINNYSLDIYKKIKGKNNGKSKELHTASPEYSAVFPDQRIFQDGIRAV